jgi:hypothetical protein
MVPAKRLRVHEAMEGAAVTEQAPSNELAARLRALDFGCCMPPSVIEEAAAFLESLGTAHEPCALRDALDAIASPSDPKDYGWWTQLARHALGIATDRERAAVEARPAPPPATARMEILPVTVAGVPDAHLVRFHVGNQGFSVGPDYWNTKAEAEWYADMFLKAVGRAAQPPGLWRSCATDPPAEWEFVMLYRAGPNQTYFLGEWYRHNNGEVLWTMNGRTGHGVEPPSHWMALPASPSTKESDHG